MTPGEARRWIEGLEVLGMRFGLERMRALLDALGHPERGRPAIHVVGSNGKSSTARLAAAALAGEGLRVGTYLSPHVTGWRERIELAGRPVTPGRFAVAVGAVRDAAADLALPPGDAVTQFEALTAAAFWAFAGAGVDAAVVEAGLGGRFDATNVLPGSVVVLTNVALEHTDLLGETEEAIAAEKLAVAPRGSDRLVVGRLSPAARVAVAAQMAARELTGWRQGAEIRVRAGRAASTSPPPGAATPGCRCRSPAASSATIWPSPWPPRSASSAAASTRSAWPPRWPACACPAGSKRSAANQSSCSTEPTTRPACWPWRGPSRRWSAGAGRWPSSRSSATRTSRR